jgi:antirestriction protein ArdC
MSERSRANAVQAREDLERAVLALRDSAAWRRHLAVLARFHHYSINNQFLIGCQMPEASYVRGFRSWLDAGRAVRKGERGIRILAPRPWQRPETDDDGEERAAGGVSFAVVHVFDVSQTDPIPGHPHPWVPPVRHAAAGDEFAAWMLWDGLMTHAGDLGLSVSTRAADPLAGPHTFGYYHHDGRAIWVRPERARADMAATLAHELAHAVTREAVAALPRAVREVVAESVAYAVGARFGLDLALRSTTYVASWLDDPAAFRAGMAAIHDGAAALIDAVDATLAQDGAYDRAA